jgi:hypothetical protein
MTDHASLVHALVAFGLDELDAWNCVHHAGAAAASGFGRDSFVLLRCEPPQHQVPLDDPLADISAEQIAAAAEHGVAWRSAGTGQWIYLQRLDWCIDQLSTLNDDLSRLADALAQLDHAGTHESQA